MSRSPGHQVPAGVETGVRVDESGLSRADGDGELLGKVPHPDRPFPGAITTGEDLAGNVQVIEDGDFFRFGGEPTLPRVLQDVVEGQQPPHQYGSGGGASMGRVPDAQGAVDGLAGDSAGPDGGRQTGQILFDRLAAVPQAADEPARPMGPRVQVAAELGVGEQAAMPADQGDPLGLGARPTEEFSVGARGVVVPGSSTVHLLSALASSRRGEADCRVLNSIVRNLISRLRNDLSQSVPRLAEAGCGKVLFEV